VPDRRKGRVNVICVIVLACVGEKEGEMQRAAGAEEGALNGTVDSEHGANMG
jgi:hypothetical protein